MSTTKAMTVALDAIYGALERPNQAKLTPPAPEWIEGNYRHIIGITLTRVRSWVLRDPQGRTLATLYWRDWDERWEGYGFNGGSMRYHGTFADLEAAKAAVKGETR